MKKKVMLKEKLLRVSIILIALFTIAIYLVTNSRVSNLLDKTIEAKVDTISKMGLDIVQSQYIGNWRADGNNLYLGNKLINNDFDIVDQIKEKTTSHITIYLGKERLVTSILDNEGNRLVGNVASSGVVKNVIEKGAPYQVTEDILGKKYAVKYTPIKDQNQNIIGMWSVGIPSEGAGNQGNKLFLMSASIVVISILCGLIGCIILMLYAKKFLSDIDTLKVSFISDGAKNNNPQKRLLHMSLLLICTFLLIWFIIQGYTVGNVVTNIEFTNVNDRLDTSSKLGYMLIDNLYKGDWSIDNNKMYKGTNYLNDNSAILERISFEKGYSSSIFMGDTRISSTLLTSNRTPFIGTKADNKVIDTVLKKGNEYSGEITVIGKKLFSRYIPLKDKGSTTIGMFGVGVDKKIAMNEIALLRKNITQISILAIIVAFGAFLFLSIKMVSDISNYKVSLHTNAN